MMDLPTFALENSKSMTEILSHFETITLDEMRDIRLMNRIDTKFVTTVPVLRRLLELASDEYYVQQVDGEVIAPYYTLYYDTEDCAMYNRHEVGHLERQKLRVRSYLHVGINYLEVKTKNNHGRTKKKRTAAEGFDPQARATCDFRLHDHDAFIAANLHYDPQRLSEHLENRFDRHHRAQARRSPVFAHPAQAAPAAHPPARVLQVLHRLGPHQRGPAPQPLQAPSALCTETIKRIITIWKIFSICLMTL